MISSFLFDLDGTLVQTEALKAESYARAAVVLDPTLTEQEVIDAFKDFVGLSRKEVAEGLMNRFNLEPKASALMTRFNVQQPWQAYVHLRMENYYEMISDPEILKSHLCPYNMGLLKWARGENYPTGLATMSQRREATRVLKVLRITDEFDFIATIEDVDRGKPNPEIYLLLSDELEIDPDSCLVIEDSASGVKAALAAGMNCIVVTTEFTRDAVHRLNSNGNMVILDSPKELLDVAKDFINRKR